MEQRRNRQIEYNKMIEMLHLDDRKAIKAMPLEKEKFGKALERYNNQISIDEEAIKAQEQALLKELKEEKFEKIFEKRFGTKQDWLKRE